MSSPDYTKVKRSLDDHALHLMHLMHRLEVARKDVEYFSWHVHQERQSLDERRRLIGASFLELMNSGISHRRFLKIVEAFEAS